MENTDNIFPSCKNTKIPSDIIEPHVKDYLMSCVQDLAYGAKTPEEVRKELAIIDDFVMRSSGIHARYAVNNTFYPFTSKSDEEMIKIAKQVFKN